MLERKLFCLDLDNTLVYSHTHDELNRRFILPHITNNNQMIINGIPKDGKINRNYDKNGVVSAINKLLSNTKTGLKHPVKTVSLIKELINAGHIVTITTFNKYPEVATIILNALKHFGLDESYIKQINVISGFPTSGPKDRNGKNEHIKEAMALSGIQNPNNVILIDDILTNIRAAKKLGCHTIMVPLGFNSNDKYLDEIKAFSISDNIILSSSKSTDENINIIKNPPSIEISIWKSVLNKISHIFANFLNQK